MTPALAHPLTETRLRVGIPWRTTREEHLRERKKLEFYFDSVRAAQGEPVGISLLDSPARLAAGFRELDAFLLPGAPSDVDPARYGAPVHAQTSASDPNRESTDLAILEHAFEAAKPVLAICYGCQILNVFLGGTLYQDIPSELGSAIGHSRAALAAEAPDPVHPARIEPGGELARLAAACGLERLESGFVARVNSSHHQSVRDLGQGLRRAAVAPDGVVEAVEHEPHKHWVVGVQWHPERMAGDALSDSLFRALVAAGRGALAKH